MLCCCCVVVLLCCVQYAVCNVLCALCVGGCCVVFDVIDSSFANTQQKKEKEKGKLTKEFTILCDLKRG